MLYQFRTSIHARPPGPLTETRQSLSGEAWDVLALAPHEQALPMTISFEEAQQRIERLPRMFFEPDGSFVWVGQEGANRWQVDGCLYDRDDRLIYVELAGRCPSTCFDQFLAALAWPEQPLIFQLPDHAAFLSEEEFRRHATAAL